MNESKRVILHESRGQLSCLRQRFSSSGSASHIPASKQKRHISGICHPSFIKIEVGRVEGVLYASTANRSPRRMSCTSP